MKFLVEKYDDNISAKDGGFIFQSIISHEVKWEIVNGETRIDPKKINSFLHQVDIFPDININDGTAMSTYVVLSEVNILKRKFDLASEAIKKRIKPDYLNEAESLKKARGTAKQKQELNLKHFNNTYYEVKLKTDKLVFREVSTSGIDSGSPRVTMKVSTSMVDTLNEAPTKTWDAFSIEVDGSSSLSITNARESIYSIKEFDEIEKKDDIIFGTIIPSLILSFKGDRTIIDTLSKRSAEVSADSLFDYENIFVTADDSSRQKANVSR